MLDSCDTFHDWEGYDKGFCCDGLPTDGVDGACGCPTDFVWFGVEQECVYQPLRCGYVDNENKCIYETPSSLIYILTHHLECLLPEEENPPYEQACCLDVSYGDNDYYTFTNIKVS